MSVDISDAIVNLVNSRIINLTRMQEGSINRVNNVGVGLEEYVKDLFANSFTAQTANTRRELLQRTFSFLGCKNSPPDVMIRDGGPAIEVKKEKGVSELQFNSSYPRRILFSSDSKINDRARVCENWQQRDMLYIVGIVEEQNIKKLCMVFGTEFFADETIYLNVEQNIRERLTDEDNVVTNELGRRNNVDPLRISNLRIRGMWLVKNPFAHFEEQFNIDNSKQFSCVALVENRKYEQLNRRTELEALQGTVGFYIQDVNVPDPNNPAQNIECKLIKFEM